MSTDAQPEQEEQSANDETVSSVFATHPRLMLAGMVVALVGSVFLVFTLYAYTDSKTADRPPNDKPNEDLEDEPNVKPPAGPEDGKDNVPSPEDADKPDEKKPSVAPSIVAVRKSKLGRLQSSLRKVKSSWSKLNNAAVEWHVDLRKRLDGDDGRKMAADRHLVERYMAVNEQDRMSQADIADLGRRLDEFREQLDATEAAVENAEWDVDEDLVTGELETVDKEIGDALKLYEDHVLMVIVLLGQAAALEPDRLSLAEVIQEIEEEDTDERIDQITEAGERTKQAHTEELKELAKKRKELNDQKQLIMDRKRTADDEAAVRDEEAQAEHNEKVRKAAEEKAALERRFEREYPAMEKYLTPFVSEGYTQPTGRTYRRTTTKGRVSYKSLVGAGVLGEGKGSVERFYYSTVTGNNDRELGAFPPHSFSGKHMERHYDTILKVQTFLREFGTVMVAKKKLAP